jgi:uncharacterized membrane protein YhaH (DUF805 family)
MGNNNIYNYKTPKSGNEETGFFNIKGRINRKSFILRWLFSFGLFVIFTLGYYNGFLADNDSRMFIFFETIYFYILPLFISIFNLIQGAKRMHDVNKSGWYFFIPLHNIYLTFSPGTIGNNDYGIDPSPTKNIQYFDEIESNKQVVEKEVTDSVKKGGLDIWRDHINKVRIENPNKTYQEILEIARNTYKSKKSTTNKSTDTTKKKSNNYLFYLIIAIATVLYYLNIYEPQHRDTVHDGIIDLCPDKPGNEIDDCYYYKKVTFNNNTRNKAWLSIAYKDKDEWVCKGWYCITAKDSYTFDLPKFFKGKEVFWYAEGENGAEWSDTYRYFYVAKGGNSSFEVRNGRFKEKGGGWGIKKGFYKLELKDENTTQGFAN